MGTNLAMRKSLAFSVFLLAVTVFGAEPPRQVVVAADGSGQFTTIAAAIASIKDATKDKPVDILIRPGTYAETITTRDWINLVGQDREKCVITFNFDGDPAQIAYRHTIWATSNTTIKNLTLIGQTVKYVIHSDGGGAYVLNVENCTLRRDYSTPHAKEYATAFGMGLHSDQHVVVRDCLIEGALPMLMHTWNDQLASCSVTLEKCTLRGQDYALTLQMLGSRQHDYWVIHDSLLQGTKASIRYLNQRSTPGAAWNGQDEIELIGSGNTLAGIDGTTMRDDAAKRLSGVELARATAPKAPPMSPAGVRKEEEYGTASGKVPTPKMWFPVNQVGPFHLKTEATEDSVIFTCPPEAENPSSFGIAGGLAGTWLIFPRTLELRMKCATATDGSVQLHYCFQPNGWLVEWKAGRVFDGLNPQAFVPVDTSSWQTYRLVARSAEDVRLFVEGVPGKGIALKRRALNAEYFQMRVVGHGTRIELGRTRLLGTVLPILDASMVQASNSWHPGGRVNVCFADGHVAFMAKPATPEGAEWTWTP